jgi:hypothetical protein
MIVLSPYDSNIFTKFIGTIKEKNGWKEEVFTYKGVDITSIIIPEEVDLKTLKTISYAFLGDILVIGGTFLRLKSLLKYLKEKEILFSKIQSMKNKKLRLVKK